MIICLEYASFLVRLCSNNYSTSDINGSQYSTTRTMEEEVSKDNIICDNKTVNGLGGIGELL